MKTMRLRQLELIRSLVAVRPELPSKRANRMAADARSAFRLAERDGCFGRTGTTLTEVLMSLMIMSIGVISVATLFPISTLRTLEANKQTNSTIARFNAEAVVDVFPNFVHAPAGAYAALDPDGGGPLPLMYEYNDTFWYGGHNYLVDPYGFQSLNPLPASEPYSPPASAPVANSIRDFFGRKNIGVSSHPAYALPRRYHGGFRFTAASNFGYPGPGQLDAAIAEAAAVVTQPDNWKLVSQAQCDTSVSPGSTVTTVTLESDADLSSITEDLNDNGLLDAGEDRNADGTLNDVLPGIRAIIFDIDGVHSEVRTLTAVTVSPPSISWNEPLPTRYDGGNIGRVRVEVSDEVYTWALSVRRRPSGVSSVDVVVFFKRSFNPEHELVHPAKFVRYKLGPGLITSMTGGAGNPPGGGVEAKPGRDTDDPATPIDDSDDNRNGVPNDIGEIGFQVDPYGRPTDDVPNNRVPFLFAVEDVNGNGSLDAGEDTNGNGTLDTFESLMDAGNSYRLRRGGYVYDTKNGFWYRIRAIENVTSTGAVLVLDESIKRDNTEDLDLDGVLDVGPGSPPAWTEDTNGNGVLDYGGLIYHPSVVNVFPLEIKEP